MLAENLPVAPVNVGVRSFPDYASVAAAAVRQLPNNSQVFAGQRDEGFYVDVGRAAFVSRSIPSPSKDWRLYLPPSSP